MAESQSRANLSSVAEQGTIGAREEGAGRVDYGGLDIKQAAFWDQDAGECGELRLALTGCSF